MIVKTKSEFANFIVGYTVMWFKKIIPCLKATLVSILVLELSCLKSLTQDSMEMDREKIRKLLKVEIRHFFKDRYEIRPEVIVIIHEV